MLFRFDPPFHKFSLVFPYVSATISESEIDECIQWFWNLGRYTRNHNIPETALSVIISHMHSSNKYQNLWSQTNITEKLWFTFRKSVFTGFYNSQFPAFALSEVAQAVIWFERNVGPIASPPCFKRNTRKSGRLWLSMVLLGHGGRNFLFARNAVAKAFTAEDGTTPFNPKTVQSFF